MNKSKLLLVVLLLVAGFLSGKKLAEIKYNKEADSKNIGANVNSPTPVPFNPTKSAKPEVKFFVMSFCPYGNRAEEGLEPVYQLLKNKVDFKPQYIVSQITKEAVQACREQSCPNRVANEEAKKKCQEAIEAKQLSGMDADTCVKTYFPYEAVADCIKKECDSLKVGAWESLHGQQELDQDVREICAYNLGDSDKWWKFVSLVNSKCNVSDVNTCWKQQAIDAGFSSDKITQCEKSQLTALLTKEVAETTKSKVSRSPTVLINGTTYNGGRSAEDYKKAICNAFETQPEECKQTLGQETQAVSGGCE